MTNITGWDQRVCPRCRRIRVHYRTQATDTDKWYCIGMLKEVSDIVVGCGKKRIHLDTGGTK